MLRLDPTIQLLNINAPIFSDRQVGYLSITAKLFNEPIRTADIFSGLRDSQ